MPRYILKIHDDKFDKDYYLEWSTVVDAPVTRGMSFWIFWQYYMHKDPINVHRLMNRANKTGSSSPFDEDGIDKYFEYNRAGPGETSISKEEILDQYCRP